MPGRRAPRRSSAVIVAAALAVVVVAVAGCRGGTDDAAPTATTDPAAPVTVEDVHAAGERTKAAGTARLAWTSGRTTIEGEWDFRRHQGVFSLAGGAELRVVHGAVFRELTARERAGQAGDDPAYRYGWAQRRVPTVDDVEDDVYFGLALEGPETASDAFRVLSRAVSVEPLPEGRDPALRGVRVALAPDVAGGGYRAPELWLDADGRIRRLQLSAELGAPAPDVDLTLRLGPFGARVEVAVPPADELNPSAAVVPVGPWDAVAEVDAAGRRFRLLAAPDNRSYTEPERRTGSCVAVVPVGDDALAPPRSYDCFIPAAPGYHPVSVATAVHPDARGLVVPGATLLETTSLEATFDDGSTADVPVSGGVFAVVVPEGRRLTALGGNPVEVR